MASPTAVLGHTSQTTEILMIGKSNAQFCRQQTRESPCKIHPSGFQSPKAAFPGLLELLPNLKEPEASLVKKTLKAIDAQAAAEAGIQ